MKFKSVSKHEVPHDYGLKVCDDPKSCCSSWLIFLIFIESINKSLRRFTVYQTLIFALFNAGIEACGSHNEKLHVKDISFHNVRFTFTAKLDRS